MWFINTLICLVQIGSLQQTLCFENVQIPISFKDYNSCNVAVDNLVDYLNDDLKKRQITIIFKCEVLDGESVAI